MKIHILYFFIIHTEVNLESNQVNDLAILAAPHNPVG